MRFSMMQPVVIQSDSLNIGADVGKLGYVIVVDRRMDIAQCYCVRVPETRKYFWMPECDLIDASHYDSADADEIIQKVMVEKALELRDPQMFEANMPGADKRVRWNY